MDPSRLDMELRARRLRSWWRGDPQGPVELQLNIVRRCNLECEFCWQHFRTPEERRTRQDWIERRLPDETLLRVVDEAGKLGVRELYITGDGEPSYRLDVAVRMVGLARKHGMWTSFTTNGTMLGGAGAEALVRSGVDRLLVSMQAPNAEAQDRIRNRKGAFRKTVDSLSEVAEWKRKLGSERPYIEITAAIYRRNYELLPDLVQFTHDVGGRVFSGHPYKMVGPHGADLHVPFPRLGVLRAKCDEAVRLAGRLGVHTYIDTTLTDGMVREADGMNDRMLRASARKRGLTALPCYQPWLGMLVDEDGVVGPCTERYGEPGQPNASDESLRDIWLGPYFGKFRDEMKARRLAPRCNECGAWRFRINEAIRGLLASHSLSGSCR